MRENMWPEGDTMTVQCPRCGAANDVQITVVRDNDDPFRPDECTACWVSFEVRPDGSTARLQLTTDHEELN